MADIVVEKATIDDHDSILDITKDEVLWGGTDYLPHCLNNWLTEANTPASNRENFKVTVSDRVIGFTSVYYINNRSVGLKFAFRVSSSVRGQGYGREISRLLNDRLRSSGVESVISAIPNIDMTDEELRSPKLGTLLTAPAFLNFTLRNSQLKQDLIVKKNLPEVDRDSFADLLKKKKLVHLFENNVVHMNWVSVTPETDDDVEFAVRKRQVVLMDDNHQSLSILTLPFPVPGGIRTTIDFYSDDEALLEDHILHQLHNLRNSLEASEDDDIILVSIVSRESFKESVENVTKKIGLVKDNMGKFGSQKREFGKMYVYKKEL